MNTSEMLSQLLSHIAGGKITDSSIKNAPEPTLTLEEIRVHIRGLVLILGLFLHVNICSSNTVNTSPESATAVGITESIGGF